MKQLFIYCLFLCSTFTVAAQEISVGEVMYLLDDGEATVITQSTTLTGDIIVPETVAYDGKDYTVTRVLDNAFKDAQITGISLPKTLVKIGHSVCQNCDKLVSVSLPEGMTTLTEDFFYDCDALTTIALPQSLTTIDGYCFYSCDNLTSINMPDNITKLGKSCFYGCKKLSEISLPKELNTLGKECFSYCTGIIEINLPAKTQSLGESCFRGCSNLEKVTLPNTISSLGSSCFEKCEALKDITLSTGLTSLPYSCFIDCTGLENITLPNSITNVGGSCFVRCTSLKNITLSNSLVELGHSCFAECTSLSAISLPSTITTLEECCFQKCSALKTITLPSSITFIGDWCFKDCVNLFKVTCQWESLSNLTLGLCSFNYNYENLHFSNIYSDAELYVPNGTIELYKATYPWSNFKYIYEKGGTNTPTEQCATPTIGYADGKLTFSSTTEGAQYHYVITATDATENGFSEDGDIAIAATYAIRAYATADGYSQSDYGGATLCFVGGNIESDGIIETKSHGIVISSSKQSLSITGLAYGENINVYDMGGKLISTARATTDKLQLNVGIANEVVIVKIGEQSVKINLK